MNLSQKNTVCETVEVEDCLDEAKCRQVEEEVCELVQEEVCTEVIPEYGAGDSSAAAECTEVFDTVVEDLCTTVNIDTCNDITETICEVKILQKLYVDKPFLKIFS